MSFPNLPTPPNSSDPSTFSAKADAFFAALPQWSQDLSSYGNAVSLGFTDTSGTNVTIPTLSVGSATDVTLTVGSGKGFATGMPVMIVAMSALTGARMIGTVSSYVESTLVVTVQHAIGAGSTYSAWRISLSAPVLSSQLWTLVDRTASATINCANANYFTRTVSAGTTFVFSNAPSGQVYSFTLEIDHTAGTITWPAGVYWPYGISAPSLTAGKKHLFVFTTTDGGATWHGAILPNYNG